MKVAFGMLLMSVGVAMGQISVLNYIQATTSSLFTSYEEAPYTVDKVGEGYEQRTYPARKWVCKSSSMADYNSNEDNMFRSLFRYITGANANNQAIDMTIPVSYEVLPDDSQLEMCFYIGQEHQASPPSPSDSQVYVKERPEVTLFSLQFGGYANNQNDWEAQMDNLKAALDKAGESYNPNKFYWSAYNSPMRFWNRRNEVWIAKN